MINDKHDLVATFTNGLGKEHNWTYKDVNADLPTPVIKDACELLTNLDIFEQDGVKLFDSIVTAKIVTTKETEIFDVKNDPKIEKKQQRDDLPIKIETVTTEKKALSINAKVDPDLLTKSTPKIEELTTLTCKNSSASFPAVSLPTLKVSSIPTRLPQTTSNDSKSINSAVKVNDMTSDKILQPPNQSLEKNGDSLRQRFARFWGKRGKNKEDPS
ncbi:MAG: DUF2922 domain-containing protein [Enterococcus malodoratus]